MMPIPSSGDDEPAFLFKVDDMPHGFPDRLHSRPANSAISLLDRMYQPGLAFQKCGVMLLDLLLARMERRDLFDHRDRHRQARLMKAVDLINAGHGARTVHFGDIGGNRPEWGMRQAFRSPRYTSRWEESPVVT